MPYIALKTVIIYALIYGLPSLVVYLIRVASSSVGGAIFSFGVLFTILFFRKFLFEFLIDLLETITGPPGFLGERDYGHSEHHDRWGENDFGTEYGEEAERCFPSKRHRSGSKHI